MSASRAAGVEPDARYCSADLDVHLHGEESLAAALLPEFAGARALAHGCASLS